MVESLAQKISGYLVSVQAADIDDREIIAYGLFHILSSALQITILTISGFLFGILPQITVFTVCFGSLKRYAGGSHASRHWTCLWGFTALANVSCFLCAFVPAFFMSYTSVAAASVTLLLLLMKAPVAHPNNPKPVNKLKKLRKIAIAVALVQFVGILTASLIAPEWAYLYILCGSAGGLSAAITLLLPMPVNN